VSPEPNDIDPERDDIQAELAAMADGSLPAPRRERLLARVEGSARDSEDLARQRRAIASMSVVGEIQAPASLRLSVATLAEEAMGRGGWRASPLRAPRLRLALAGGLAIAILAAALLVLTSGGARVESRSAPTVLEASRVALLPAALAAPTESPDHAGLLQRSVDGIAYPYWGSSLGWQATGARTDRLGAHTITTVFYTDRNGRRVGYAIVAGSALPTPASGAVVEQRGVRFHVLLDAGGVRVVTWRESDHTCILAARGVSSATLLRLAGWARA
jgi:hypothetical protein